MGVGTTRSFAVPDNGTMEWVVTSSPANLGYTISQPQHNYESLFTPNAIGSYQVKARANYGCGYSAYSNPVNIASIENKPDLVVQSLSVSAPSGSNITVNHYIKNNGAQPASPLVVNYYRSTNSTYDVGDTYLDTWSSASSLDAGELSPLITRNMTLAGSGSYIIAYVDPNNSIAEINEGNNTMARILIDGMMASGSGFVVYPVPFEDELNIDIVADENGNEAARENESIKEVYLIDFQTSRVVYQTTAPAQGHVIDTRQIPSGQYVLMIKGRIAESLLVVKK